MPTGKFPTGTGFEIAFEGGGFGPIAKGNGRLNAPGEILACVRNLSGIMGSETLFEIIGQADIMAVGVAFTHENVRVVEHGPHHSWLAKPSCHAE